jgi:hypothetical protein
MSVLIKGLKMPKNCDACPMFYECRLCALTDDHAESIGWKTEEKRMPNCPLIELPDHGDLVDRDEFIKVHREYFCTDCVKRKGVKNGRMRILYEIGGVPCRACGVDDMFEYLDDAPVVIPAERSE